jgi:chromosome segregation and condensation protein ScpB
MSTLTDELIRKAKASARETEEPRVQTMLASDRRAEALFALAAEGLSMRKIADATGVSLSVVQRLLDKARASRPALGRREERVAYELHRAVAEKIMLDPEPVLRRARENLRTMLARRRDDYSAGWVREWGILLQGDVAHLVEAMLRPDERGIDLRQMSPFAGALTQDERMAAIHKAQGWRTPEG